MHDRPLPGACTTPEPGLRMILAPNPSPMTGWGTNTFLIGTGDVAVIDPGPPLAAHLAAILAALRPGERISHILVTHPHLDHSPLAPALARQTGARVLGFGRFDAGRSAVMQRLADTGTAGGGEGIDTGFVPDLILADGDRVAAGDWQLQALHTPGHFAGHLSFAWNDRLFCGDHVMGWSTSLVSPPDGDMGDYRASLQKLTGFGWQRLYPAHGAAITEPLARLHELIRHRQDRESAILAALTAGPATLNHLTRRVYSDIDPALLPAAARNLFAHLIDLTQRKLISADPDLSPDAVFAQI